MENDIIKFLNLTDASLQITKIEIIKETKIIHIQKKLVPEYCPICSTRMFSKGIYKRSVNHPILQDGYQLTLLISQRKWKCSNPLCKHIHNDEFSFIEKYKQSTNITPFLILSEMKDLSKTTTEVASRFNVSDTYVHYTFMQYIDLQRLPLPKYLSIDEVYLNIDDKNKYALVLMDFVTGEIIDILPNRKDETTADYFYAIPREERNKVEYIICDMYNPYLNYTTKYFKNAQAIVDSFHVIQWLNRKINLYINQIKKKYQDRDNKELQEKNKKSNKDAVTLQTSKEVYLLNNYRWVLLKNRDRIDYSTFRRYNRKLRMYLDTVGLENAFLSLEDNFLKIRILKEKYIAFNQLEQCDENTLSNELSNLIKEYANSELSIFKEFSDLLVKYRKEILNSFLRVESKLSIENNEELFRRLSNGPMEGFNRKPKDYKRNSRGISNFYYTRNRILWATRLNPTILAIPKTKKSIYFTSELKRGKYKK